MTQQIDVRTTVAEPDTRTPGRGLIYVGGAVLGALVILAFVGPLVYPYDHYTQHHDAILTAPSPTHWLGTSRLGEDVLAQCIRGLQKSLLIGCAVAVFATAIGAVVGTVAGYVGGRVDAALMWCVDVLLILPSVLVVAVLSPMFVGRSWLLLVVAITAFQWMLAARMIRARTISLRGRGFVLAAENMGASRRHVVVRHLLPNMAALLIVDATLNVGVAVIAEAGLSYFGFGITLPDVSLGTLIAAGGNSATTYPWTFLAPVGFLVATVVAVGSIGEGIRLSRGGTDG